MITFFSNLSSDTISAIAAIGGAVGVKLFEKIITRSKYTPDEVKDILKTDLLSCQTLVNELRIELQKWQTKYWKMKLEADVLEHDTAELKRQIVELESEPTSKPDDDSSSDSK